MNLPLPPGHSRLLTGTGTNPSLYFNRAFSEYSANFRSREADARDRFLRGFRDRFASTATAEYEAFLHRRITVLASLAATTVTLISTQPLVLGLGLPHPTETSMLLDRLTGCPYVPGSTLKGVLRHAARLTAEGRLPLAEPADPAGYWTAHLDSHFGPPIGEGETPAAGSVSFYDAFPAAWPSLTLDVLTPHHRAYYADPSLPPGDWEEPVPIPFLTVDAGTAFRFAFGPSRRRSLPDEDVAALRELLIVALDWLGVGGKTTSQGYGAFSKSGPDPSKVTVLPIDHGDSRRRGADRQPEDKTPIRPKLKGQTVWTNVELTLERGKATVYRGSRDRAQCRRQDLDRELLELLDKKGSLVVDAEVGPGLGGAWRIVAVRLADEDPS